MSIVQALLACSQPETRRHAEEQLHHAERDDFPQFVLACGGVLRDRSGPPYARHLAGILLKNAVATGEDGPRCRQLARRWSSQAADVRSQVCVSILDALMDPADNGARRAAALCIARIGGLEVPKGSWPELVPRLIAQAKVTPQEHRAETNGSNADSFLAEEAMAALGFLAEEWWSHLVRDCDVRDASEQILVAAVQGLSAGPVKLRSAAARALHAVLPFTTLRRLQRNDPSEAAAVIRAVLSNCGREAPEGLRSEAFRCLARCMGECYKHLDADLIRDVATASLTALQELGTPTGAAIQALEVWTALAEHELAMLVGTAAPSCQQVTKQALSALLPAVLEALARAPEADGGYDEDEGFDVSEAARACLAAVAKTVSDACVGPVLSFVEAQLASPEICRQRSAILAFGCIQEGPAAVTMKPLIGPVLPGLLTSFASGRFPVAVAAAWALGRALQLHPTAVPDSVQATLFEICLDRLRTDPRLAVEVCNCIDGLVTLQAATLTPEIFVPAVNALIDCAAKATTSQARTALVSSLTDIVGQSSEECVSCMEPVLCSLLTWTENCVHADPNQIPDRLVSCLRALTARLRDTVAPHAERLLTNYTRLLETHYRVHCCCDVETLRAAGTLAAALGQRFGAAVPIIWPILLAAMQHADDDVEGCLAALRACRDVSEALGPAVEPHAPVMLEVVVGLLRRPAGLNARLGAPTVLCLGSICGGLGPKTPDVRALMGLLAEQAAETSSERCAMGAQDVLRGAVVSSTAVPVAMARPVSVSEAAARGGPIAVAVATPSRRPVGRTPPSFTQVENQLPDAILQAYTDIINGFRREKAMNLLSEMLLGILSFACQHAGAAGAPQTTMRIALRLVGALAADFPAEMSAFMRSADGESQRKAISRLASWGATLPNKIMRGFAANLSQVLPQGA
eukprot:TRINITY_DN33093_c0_g1_i1.p1 TRINITY_DN33093_c0_g1~~TRINITY_DN33093_c0_g1_i1.p1  ORF type:complete len:919 (-),score=145.84 TRINITY_DN33093_c0_g1_i1:149-2905(-)